LFTPEAATFMVSGAMTSLVTQYPSGFRPRRGLNWGALGLMYASYYMCRYNFRFAGPGMNQEFGFNTADLANLWVIWSLAYGTGSSSTVWYQTASAARRSC
jgi:OPA family glycerol-3-phosphate transporter-like MFS transporter